MKSNELLLEEYDQRRVGLDSTIPGHNIIEVVQRPIDNKVSTFAPMWPAIL